MFFILHPFFVFKSFNVQSKIRNYEEGERGGDVASGNLLGDSGSRKVTCRRKGLARRTQQFP